MKNDLMCDQFTALASPAVEGLNWLLREEHRAARPQKRKSDFSNLGGRL